MRYRQLTINIKDETYQQIKEAQQEAAPLIGVKGEHDFVVSLILMGLADTQRIVIKSLVSSISE